MLYFLHLLISTIFWRSHEEFDCDALQFELFEYEAEVCTSLELTVPNYDSRLFVNAKDLVCMFIRAQK